jgi:hypothetical protein
MVYICVFKYESTSYLGVSFQATEPNQNPAPGVKCVLFGSFPDSQTLQIQLMEYLNQTFPGNGKNLFNTSVENIQKLVGMLAGAPLQSIKQQQPMQQQQQQQQNSYMPLGYIVARPTRNDDSEFSRVPVSSFSYANHLTDIPMMRQQQDAGFVPAKLAQADINQYNFKQTQNGDM